MRAAVDARPALDPRKTGVGHYVLHLLRELPGADPDTRFFAWYLHAKGALRRRAFFAEVGAPNFSERATPFPARIFEPLSSRAGFPRLEWFVGFDVLLATNFLPPATRGRFVMVVHDLAFRMYPETAPHADARWRRRFERCLYEAAGIIVPSESAKRDLVELYSVPPERVDAIHHGVYADAFGPVPETVAGDVRGRLGVERPYLLFVGGIEPRKNLEALVRAFSLLGEDPGATLVIAGGAVRWFPEAAGRLDAAIAELPERARRRVVRTGYVSESDKRALLAEATAFVYPSLYEGFGLPVLEAMAAGTPVATSGVSSLPEVAGDAALLTDPLDEDAMAGALHRLLTDEMLRERLRRAGLERVAGFTWRRTAGETAGVLRRAARHAWE